MAATPSAEAQLLQPDPQQPFTIPLPVSQNEINDATGLVPGVPNAGMYTSLPALFAFRNETIDYQMDAMTEPSTFSPLCSFSGTLVLRGGGCQLAFGWYNAVQSGGPPPAADEIYPLIPANDPVVYGGGAFTPLATNGPWEFKTFTAGDIRNDARYQGGQIGFALIGGGGGCSQTKYSQRELNQMCTACTPNERFITTVVYAGTQEDNSYYMAFEDLPVNPNGFRLQNDGDFNDFVFYITGIVCSGGGEPCDTGLQGACAVGRTDCSETGEPGQCRETTRPTDEKCDNVDNDCNGLVDDGDLCPPGKVCDNGTCVAACNAGEFRCQGGLECDRGFCVDPLCIGVPCEMGKACRKGQCVGACDGVTCPLGQECQLGRCVDLCAGVTCQEGQVCENGLCLAECSCRDCGAGKACATDGQCKDVGCETLTCQPGQVCVAGACRDACEGAVCPGGGACVNGNCQAELAGDDDPTTGGTNGTGGGIVLNPTAGTLNLSGSGGSGTAGGGNGQNNNGSPILKSGEDVAGCACRAGAGASSSWAGLAAAAVALAAFRRRRQRP